MSRDGFRDDASVFFYLVPFIASGVYGLFLWVTSGVSATLPTSVYLSVTRDPYIFLVGSFAVLLGAIIEVNSAVPSERGSRLSSVGGTLQTVALSSFVLALLAAWYANGFLDISGMASDFIVGRFSLVFPALLVLLSYLLTAQFNLKGLRNQRMWGIVFLLLVPVAIYEIGRRQAAVGLGVAFILMVAGVAILLVRFRSREPSAPKQAKA